MAVSKTDIGILQDLGKEVAAIAALPVQKQRIKEWKALNGLKPIRPMVLIDQIPWHEMNVNDELTLKTEDPFCRGIEHYLRRTIYKWNHMRVDMVMDHWLDIPMTIQGTDFRINIKEEVSVMDAENSVVGHAYEDQFKTEEDLEKITMPDPVLDEEATRESEEKAREIFDGILEVRMNGMIPSFAMWDRIVTWHGVEQSIIDLLDRPDFIHKMMSRYTGAMITLTDRLQERGLLGQPQSLIHCTGAYTDELPKPGFDPAKPRTKDLWTFGMSQIFATVSPEMHREFEIEYAKRCYEKFGLVYYGCCEPLHSKIDIIRELPNVRKISMSPWVDQKKGAKNIGSDYVFSRKPSPAFLAGSSWEPEQVESDLRDTVRICAEYGCPLELILKDISTVKYEPRRLWGWADIAMKVIEES
jgi:hypothetical protein